jgi:hypothetical protein
LTTAENEIGRYITFAAVGYFACKKPSASIQSTCRNKLVTHPGTQTITF